MIGYKNFHHPGQPKTWPLLEYGETPMGTNPLLREHPTYFYGLVSMSGKSGENDLCAEFCVWVSVISVYISYITRLEN